MTDGLLENIIQLEKKIQADVADEEVRARIWQARELAELMTDRDWLVPLTVDVTGPLNNWGAAYE